MAARLIRVALTGGIGTGKSYCLERFAALGAPVISADALARAAVAPGAPALEAIRREFGPSVFAGEQLDRAALAQVVFHDPAARRALEAIVHPIVYARILDWFQQVQTAEPSASSPVAVADIPLLFETGRHRDFDRVIVAACDPATQLERVIARAGVTEAEARARIAAQDPIDDKRARADYVIETGGTFAETDQQVEDVWIALTRGAHEPGPAQARGAAPPTGVEP